MHAATQVFALCARSGRRYSRSLGVVSACKILPVRGKSQDPSMSYAIDGFDVTCRAPICCYVFLCCPLLCTVPECTASYCTNPNSVTMCCQLLCYIISVFCSTACCYNATKYILSDRQHFAKRDDLLPCAYLVVPAVSLRFSC